MGQKKVLQGFDYRLRKQVERSRAEWREELKKTVSHGGFRRVDRAGTYLAYGGDFGPLDVPTDYNFCMNGLVDALADLGAKGIVVTDIRTCRL